MPAVNYVYEAFVLDVYDGDTVTLRVDLGFHTQTVVKARLAGIDTPELRGGTGETKAAAKAARDFLRDLILFRDVTIKTTKTGKYGRWIVDIFLSTGDNVNNILVNRGHAKNKDYN